MRFLIMLALAGASVTPLAGTTVSREQRAGSTITIVLTTAPDVDQALMDHIVEEAEAIWSAAGVTLMWPHGSVPVTADAPHIAVVIDDVRPGLPQAQGPLGWIPFAPGGPEPSIHLSRASADLLCNEWPNIVNKTMAGHERLVGRALGRALSHELGHYLFQSKLHTTHGLMRATWPSDELFSVDRHGFELTADQRTATEKWLQTFGWIAPFDLDPSEHQR